MKKQPKPTTPVGFEFSNREIIPPTSKIYVSDPLDKAARFGQTDRMTLLNTCKLIAFVGTQDVKSAKEFYADRLGLLMLSNDGFALVFDAHGTVLRVTLVPKVAAAGYTVLGWEVADIASAARELHQAGVTLERFPGMEQDELGVWTAPGGFARVAWFKDPDGNVLSISQHS